MNDHKKHLDEIGVQMMLDMLNVSTMGYINALSSSDSTNEGGGYSQNFIEYLKNDDITPIKGIYYTQDLIPHETDQSWNGTNVNAWLIKVKYDKFVGRNNTYGDKWYTYALCDGINEDYTLINGKLCDTRIINTEGYKYILFSNANNTPMSRVPYSGVLFGHYYPPTYKKGESPVEIFDTENSTMYYVYQLNGYEAIKQAFIDTYDGLEQLEKVENGETTFMNPDVQEITTTYKGTHLQTKSLWNGKYLPYRDLGNSNIYFEGALNLEIANIPKKVYDGKNTTTDYADCFLGCEYLTDVIGKPFEPKYLTEMFCYCFRLKDINTRDWDISNVKSMNNAFRYCTSLTTLDLSKWNTGNCTDMQSMFMFCPNLENVDVSNWDMSKVTTIRDMFNNCFSITSLDVSKWDVSKVTNSIAAFQQTGLTEFNAPDWNTSSLITAGSMFKQNSDLISVDIANWDVSNVKTLDNFFLSCTSLTTLDLSKWNTENVTTVADMFHNCTSLTTLDLSKWNTGNCTDMRNLFQGCSNLESVDVSAWDVSKVTTMRFMFQGCSKLKEINVSNWKLDSLVSLDTTFKDCNTITELDVSNWTTDNVNMMYGLFMNCTSLTTLDLSKWNFMKVTNGNNMFYGCTNLATITFPGSSSFPLSYVGFENCNNLTSDTIANILDALYDFTNDPSSLADNGITYSKKVKFSRTAYDALTEDQIKTATDKGWTVERA